jgi:hypothetical protein
MGLDHPDVICPIVQAPIKLSEAFILGLPVALILVGPLVLTHDVQTVRTVARYTMTPTLTPTRSLIGSRNC